MKYVLINEYYSSGGTEIQSLREKHLMERKGHKVLYITFDSSLPQGWDRKEPHHFNFSISYTNNQRRLYSYVRDRKLSIRVKWLIDRFRPDFIHVNNSYGYSYVISCICRKYPSVKTIRDYGAVCPNGLCVDRNGKVCTGSSANNCVIRCMPKRGKRPFLSDCFKYRKRNRCDRRSIDVFICPSMTLTNYCRCNGLKAYCINNPFDFSVIDSNSTIHRKGSIRKFFYYGLVAKHKGVMQLIEAFKKFSEGRDVTLEIAGQLDDSLSGYFEKAISDSTNIIYHGRLPYPDTMKLLSQVDCVVVPSLWMENYPNTVLESLSSGCIALASDRGGMKEMIHDDRMIFDVLDQQDIISKLKFAYSLSADEIEQITQRNYHRVKYNNSLERYYRRFMNLVSVLTKDK